MNTFADFLIFDLKGKPVRLSSHIETMSLEAIANNYDQSLPWIKLVSLQGRLGLMKKAPETTIERLEAEVDSYPFVNVPNDFATELINKLITKDIFPIVPLEKYLSEDSFKFVFTSQETCKTAIELLVIIQTS